MTSSERFWLVCCSKSVKFRRTICLFSILLLPKKSIFCVSPVSCNFTNSSYLGEANFQAIPFIHPNTLSPSLAQRLNTLGFSYFFGSTFSALTPRSQLVFKAKPESRHQSWHFACNSRVTTRSECSPN